jgi:hypothetical protein
MNEGYLGVDGLARANTGTSPSIGNVDEKKNRPDALSARAAGQATFA